MEKLENKPTENEAKKLKKTEEKNEQKVVQDAAKNVAVKTEIVEQKNEADPETKSKKAENEQNKKIKKDKVKIPKDKQLKPCKKKGKKKLIIILIIVLVLLLLSLSTAFGIFALISDKIVSGVSINGIDISNLTKQQAIEKLTENLANDFDRKIEVKRENFSSELDANSFEAHYNIEETVSQAYNIGRSSNNIFTNNFDVLNALLFKNKVKPVVNFNNDLLEEKIDAIENEMPDRLINFNYKIEGSNLIVTSGSDGNKIVRNRFKDLINSALVEKASSIEIPVEHYHTDDVDIDAVYKKVYKAPVDAKFTAEPYDLQKEETGLDFAISIEEARSMVADRQDSYTIPLKIIKPSVTVKDLPREAFPDELATFSTTYASSNYNRSQNISLAAGTVNGIVLMPDETFSYNETLGQRTTAKGYREAGAYVNGEVSSEVGGGICQVSSTLYNAALLCNLEIVDRTNHTFEPSYVPAGQDATVSWRSPDFKFKNNRKYPVKLVATAGGGRVTFTIYGKKSDDDYEVKIVSSKTGSIPFSTQYENDPSLPVGTTKVLQSGSNGCRSVTYKILYKNGQEISRALINSDTYKPHNQVVAKGTKPVPVPTPSDSSNQGENNASVTITNIE